MIESPGFLVFSTAEGGTLTLIGELPPSHTEQSRVIGENWAQTYTHQGLLRDLRRTSP